MIDVKKAAPAAQPMSKESAPAKAAAPVAPQAPQESKIDFDAWWAMRASKIPMQHRKEVVKADMRGRGISDKETIAAYDKGLAMYGVKL